MSGAVYAIDEKRRKALAEDPIDPPARLEPAEAIERLTRYHYTPKAVEGTEEIVAWLARWLKEPTSREGTPTAEQQDALFAHFSRFSDPPALFSLFADWRGVRGLLDLVLTGGTFHLENDPPNGKLAKGGTPGSGWTLKYAVRYVAREAPKMRDEMREAVKAAALGLIDRSAMAAYFDDRAWAGELIDEWLAQPLSGPADWDALGLVGTTDDPERFRRAFAAFSGQHMWGGKSFRLGRALGRVPADVLVGTLVPVLEAAVGAKWKSASVEPYAKALSHVKSADVARVFALWLKEKSVAKVAAEYFRKHPDLAGPALAPIARGKGKDAATAKAILESLGRDEANAAPADDAGQVAVALPPSLVSPPWRDKKRAVERPKLPLDMIVEGESYDLPPAPRVVQRPANHTFESVAAMPRGSWWMFDSWRSWHGEQVVPHLIRFMALDIPGAYRGLERAVSARLALPVAKVALARSGGNARTAAKAWLREHEAVAALGLIPAALGADDAEADVAERALRAMDREVVAAAAARHGEAASKAVAQLLSRSPYLRFPPRMPPKARWAAPDRLGALELSAGGALSAEQAQALVEMLQISPSGAPYLGAVETIALLSEASRARWAKALLDEYLLAGSPPSHEWVIDAVAMLSPKEAIARLGAQMRAWAADGKVPLLHRSLEALAEIGSDEALVVVHDAGQRSRYDDTREKVREILEDVARDRGVTYEVLEDLLVPELGLEGGAVELDLGARQLKVRLGDHLEAILTDAEGKALAAFPRKVKADDEAKYAAAKARHAALLEASETVGRGQILRFERALREQRSWTVADLRERVLPQPLVQHLARRLVWQVAGTEQLFRVAEDLTPATAEDEPCAWPPADARVVLAHPITAPGLGRFATWLEDYQVIQPFAQVGRETFRFTADETTSTSRASGRKAAYGGVLGLTLGMGWKPIPPGEKGIDAITRELPGGATARLAITPGLLFGGAKGRPEQTLGALTIEGGTFASLDPLSASELLRDVLTLGA